MCLCCWRLLISPCYI
ncbi:hypothetical protein CSPAE12_11854 [Colletotrichum incanum]|nr:hypothetical protein CSPAE12_11854 [Colletotrichum incanum]